MNERLAEVLLIYGVFTMYYALLINLGHLVIMAFSFRSVFKIIARARYSRFESMSGSKYVPPISILVPIYNEEARVIESIKSLLSLDYPLYEVIVINDGSKDNTLGFLIDEFKLSPLKNVVFRKVLKTAKVKGVFFNPRYPNLFIIDKKNGGKADALNSGINICHYPLIASVDANSILEKDALIRIANTYMESPEETVAVGGNVKISNNCIAENGVIKKVKLPSKSLPMFQSLEYIRSFLGGKIGWSTLNGLLMVSGSFGVFKKEYLIRVGGYKEKLQREDMNIILKLHQHMLENKLKYKITFCPDAICWTQAPDTLKGLSNQRKRWAKGSLKNILEYKFMILNPKYKIVGLLSLPFTLFFVVLAPYLKISGFLALLGYLFFYMNDFSINIFLIYIGVNIFVGFLLEMLSLILEELLLRRFPKMSDILRMVLNSFIISIGYRQLCSLWMFLGQLQFIKDNLWNILRGKKADSIAIDK